MVGGAVGFYSGDIRRLADDLSALKPTMMPAVPRLLNRLYDKAQSEISGSKIKKLLFNMALSAKESELKRSVLLRLVSFRLGLYRVWKQCCMFIAYLFVSFYVPEVSSAAIRFGISWCFARCARAWAGACASWSSVPRRSPATYSHSRVALLDAW